MGESRPCISGDRIANRPRRVPPALGEATPSLLSIHPILHIISILSILYLNGLSFGQELSRLRNQGCRRMDSKSPTPSRKPSMGVSVLQTLCTLSRRLGLQKDLSANDLRRAACRSTGLTDWGEDPLGDLFDNLVASLESDGNLTPLGRVMARHGLIRLLKNRLYIQRELAACPDTTHRCCITCFRSPSTGGRCCFGKP